MGKDAAREAAPIAGAEICDLSRKSAAEPGDFARYLNMTVGYVSRLECGVCQPTGPALAMPELIRRSDRGVTSAVSVPAIMCFPIFELRRRSCNAASVRGGVGASACPGR